MWVVFKKIKSFFVRFLHGSALSIISLKAYDHYKKLLLIPFLGALTSTIVFMAIGSLCFYFLDHVQRSKTTDYLIITPCIIVLLFCISCINVISNMLATYMLTDYCEHQKASFTQALAHTWAKKRLVLIWICLETVIRIFSKKNTADTTQASSMPGASFFSFISGVSWSYLSFFIYPIFAFEEKSLLESLKQSVILTKNYFGSMAGALTAFSLLYRFFIPFFTLGVLWIVIMIIWILAWIFEKLHITVTIASHHVDLVTLLICILTVIIAFTFALHFISIARAVTSTLLYRRIHNLSTGMFRSTTLDNAVKELQS